MTTPPMIQRSLYFISFRSYVETLTATGLVLAVKDDSSFGVQPYDPKYQAHYAAMTRRISLTADAGWNEAQLQSILRKSDFWEGFPLADAKLVRAEFRPGTLDQRIDILFITKSAELVPCELKIRGDYADSHGQLIRYIADLANQPWDLTHVQNAHDRFSATINDDTVQRHSNAEFSEFISTMEIPPTAHIPIRRGGVIMDVAFRASTVNAVRYLNHQCGFSIQLVEIRAFVPDDWTPTADDRWMRLDFVPLPL